MVFVNNGIDTSGGVGLEGNLFLTDEYAFFDTDNLAKSLRIVHLSA